MPHVLLGEPEHSWEGQSGDPAGSPELHFHGSEDSVPTPDPHIHPTLSQTKPHMELNQPSLTGAPLFSLSFYF